MYICKHLRISNIALNGAVFILNCSIPLLNESIYTCPRRFLVTILGMHELCYLTHYYWRISLS